MWNNSAEQREADKTWQYVGLAVRIATDLRLNSKMTFRRDGLSEEAIEEHERDIRNRERTW